MVYIMAFSTNLSQKMKGCRCNSNLQSTNNSSRSHYQNDFEQVIHFIRIPLIIGVVLIHSSVKCADDSMYMYTLLHRVFSELLVSPCVPTFFFISGFLFFYNTQTFDYGCYLNKMKRRCRTLFVPYLFWNALVLFYYLLGHLCFSNLIDPNNCNVLRYTPLELIRSFWDFPGGFPVCYQFWYLRDLMVFCLLSPIVYFVVKRCAVYTFPILVLLWLCLENTGKFGTSIPFVLGCCFSILKINVLKTLFKYKFWFCAIFYASVVLRIIGFDFAFLNKIMTLSGIGAFIIISHILIIHIKSLSNLRDRYSFFIYGFHGFPIVLLTSTILPKIFHGSEIMCILQYVLAPLIVIVIAIVLYETMNKLCPKFLSIITGGRIKMSHCSTSH